MNVEKINESYSVIEADKTNIDGIKRLLKAEIPNSHFDKAVQYGIKDKYVYFYKTLSQTKILVYNGHLSLLKNYGIHEHNEKSEVSDEEFNNYISSVSLPFTPYDYQLNNVKLALQNNKMIFKSCTSCLDPNTEIDVDIPGYTEQEIQEMLDE